MGADSRPDKILSGKVKYSAKKSGEDSARLKFDWWWWIRLHCFSSQQYSKDRCHEINATWRNCDIVAVITVPKIGLIEKLRIVCIMRCEPEREISWNIFRNPGPGYREHQRFVRMTICLEQKTTYPPTLITRISPSCFLNCTPQMSPA